MDGRGLAGSDLADEPEQFCHLRRNAYHIVVSGAPANFPTQRFDFGTQTGGFERILDRDRQLVEVERLADEVVGPQLERVLDVVQLRVRRDHNDGARVVGFLDLLENVEAAGIGQAHVKQHEIRRLVMRHAKRSRTGVSL
jgi:hypothetical protein